MDFLYLLVKSLLLPPGLIVFLMLIGFATRRLFFVILGLVLLYLLSTPFVAGKLISGLQIYPPLTETQLSNSKAQAIVVLAAGRYTDAPEFGGQDMASGLWRLRYAAYLQRKTELPIYATGGSPYVQGRKSEAELIKYALEQEYRVGPVFTEDKSNNTRESAIYTASLLKQAGINTVYLVSNSWHLPRAVKEFQRAGLEVIPAPTLIAGGAKSGPWYKQWLPKSLSTSRKALHEYMGQVWYEIKHISKSLQGGEQTVTQAAQGIN